MVAIVLIVVSFLFVVCSMFLLSCLKLFLLLKLWVADVSVRDQDFRDAVDVKLSLFEGHGFISYLFKFVRRFL